MKPRYLNYVSTIEGIFGIAILWIGVNLFFTDQIDYNTRYVIGGTLVIGFALIAFSLVDRIRARVLTHMFKRDVIIRFATILVIAIMVGGVVAVNNSIADAKKIVDSAPAPIKEGCAKEEAEEIKSKLEAAGAEVELK